MVSSRMLVGDVLGAVFEDESGSDDDNGDDIYGYLGEQVLCRDDLEADSLAVYEPIALDDTCMPGDIFSDTVDDGAQERGTDINGGDSNVIAMVKHHQGVQQRGKAWKQQDTQMRW